MENPLPNQRKPVVKDADARDPVAADAEAPVVAPVDARALAVADDAADGADRHGRLGDRRLQ